MLPPPIILHHHQRWCLRHHIFFYCKPEASYITYPSHTKLSYTTLFWNSLYMVWADRGTHSTPSGGGKENYWISGLLVIHNLSCCCCFFNQSFLLSHLLEFLLLRQQDTKAIMRDEKTHEEEEERGQWTNPCDFFISCLGYAVGLGDT